MLSAQQMRDIERKYGHSITVDHRNDPRTPTMHEYFLRLHFVTTFAVTVHEIPVDDTVRPRVRDAVTDLITLLRETADELEAVNQ